VIIISKKNTKKSFKDKLENNKIYFEVLVTLLLSIMAIIVSVQSNRIADNQTMIMKEQALPQFRINKIQIYNEEIGKYTDDNIVIYNQGGILYDFSHKTAVYMNLQYKNKDNLYQTKRIPLKDYYKFNSVTGNGKGLLVTIGGNQNHQKIVDAESNNNYSIQIDIKQYVNLNYKDIFGEYHTDYYYIPAVGWSNQLSHENGKEIFKKYEESMMNEDEFISMFNLESQLGELLN